MCLLPAGWLVAGRWRSVLRRTNADAAITGQQHLQRMRASRNPKKGFRNRQDGVYGATITWMSKVVVASSMCICLKHMVAIAIVFIHNYNDEQSTKVLKKVPKKSVMGYGISYGSRVYSELGELR